MTMRHPQKSTASVNSPLHKFRRRYVRKRHQRICRVIETLAVMLGIIFFLHLIEISRKGPAVPRHKHEARSEPVFEGRSGTIVTQQVALVPEPKAAMFVLLGLATICYSRRQKIVAASPSATEIFQPSKMTTAAA